MEKEIKNLEDFKKLTARYLNTLKPSVDEDEMYTAQIKFINYYQLGCVIKDMLKLCALAIDHDIPKINPSINLSLIIETALQLFPTTELELLSDINQKIIAVP